MNLAKLKLVFTNHPKLPEELFQNYQARDSRGVERGFHKHNSSRYIILTAAATNDMTFLKTYLTALVEENALHFLAAVRRAKTNVYSRDDIGKLKEFTDLPADEKALKVFTAMSQIDSIFNGIISIELNNELDTISSAHNDHGYKAKLQELLAASQPSPATSSSSDTI